MNIVESFTQAKTGMQEDNEDAFVITDSYIAVIDGMTPKDRTLYNGESPAQIAVRLIADTISSFPRFLTFNEAAVKLTNCLRNYYFQNGIIDEAAEFPHKRMGANLIILSLDLKEIWMIGDCQCLIDGQRITNEKLIDALIANMRSDILQSYLKKYPIEQLMEEDPSWKDIQPFMLNQYSFQNSQAQSPLSYAVCDGFSIQESQLKRIDVQNAESIILASDGYPELENTLEATEEKLQLLLKNDPLCFSIHKSVKGLKKGNVSFDDRTYVKVRLK